MTKSPKSKTGLSLKSMWIETLETQAESFIQRIPELDDHELIKKYRQVLRLGHSVWLVECALAADMLDRAVRKRGKIDQDQTGVLAAARKLGAEVGVTAKTIYLSAQIYRTFFGSEVLHADVKNFEKIKSLDQKSYFEVALSSPNPQETIREFAERKSADPDFSVKDARRMIANEAAPSLEDVIWENLDSEDRRACWENYQRACRWMRQHFPLLTLEFADHLETVKQHLTEPSLTIREAILQKLREGSNTVEDLSEALGKPRDFVRVWLGRLIDAGLVIVKEGERKEGARGAIVTQYRAT